jgi:uncharacterized protein (DUF433 family)
MDRIEKRPGKCGGSATIKGTRITVRCLAWYDREGWTAEETAEIYSLVDASDIEAAWAYAKEHPEELAPDGLDSKMDLDDAVAGHPIATKELAELRALLGALESQHYAMHQQLQECAAASNCGACRSVVSGIPGKMYGEPLSARVESEPSGKAGQLAPEECETCGGAWIWVVGNGYDPTACPEPFHYPALKPKPPAPEERPAEETPCCDKDGLNGLGKPCLCACHHRGKPSGNTEHPPAAARGEEGDAALEAAVALAEELLRTDGALTIKAQEHLTAYSRAAKSGGAK